MKLVILARLLRFCYMNRSWNSEWAPYVDRLPQPSSMHNSIFWSDDELEMIRQSSMYEETIKQKNFIEKEFLAVKQILGKCDIIGRDDEDEDDEEDVLELEIGIQIDIGQKEELTENLADDIVGGID